MPQIVSKNRLIVYKCSKVAEMQKTKYTEHAGTCWNTLEHPGTSWNMLEHAEIDEQKISAEMQ